ncbi:GNAT family N-acetyltransferase [Methylobacillus arboreus]|uniref:GNAT family N-acetyltransferase n=1 Tax=Methylobacillus arboreus TaxID=755170 RepID=UPI001E37102F|nr:GNAT family N-acetyltransferase [Methylobacillus arboreus]MCB5191444.1 GNAT family N-acetyltransferase [Methylobacillus arboreus]
MKIEVEIVGSVSELDSAQWNALTDGSPLLSHAFLSALEHSGSVGEGTGWEPMPLVFKQDGRLVGAVPLYLKHHSYGEYVFDWSWAEAYAQYGLEYYPKLVAAVPFTPITGARLLSPDLALRLGMADVLRETIHRLQLSSVHVLFPDLPSAEPLLNQGWIRRQGVQFRWQNPGFSSFDEFLMTLTHDKRKKIRQERKKVASAGVTCRRLRGAEITPREWDFFYKCYINTYLEHRSSPYLTQAFFHELGERLPDNIMLVLAERDGRRLGAALNLYDDHCLYGRYWGALGYVPNLHFELCYYQAQEFCIEAGINFFEGGAQGEHKLARGFTPRETCSFHQIAHPDFEAAVRRFVAREEVGISHYQQELDERAPYRKSD